MTKFFCNEEYFKILSIKILSFESFVYYSVANQLVSYGFFNAEHSEVAGRVHEERTGLHGHGVHAVRRPKDLPAGPPPSCQRAEQRGTGRGLQQVTPFL
jgi:hypothetical protein